MVNSVPFLGGFREDTILNLLSSNTHNFVWEVLLTKLFHFHGTLKGLSLHKSRSFDCKIMSLLSMNGSPRSH